MDRPALPTLRQLAYLVELSEHLNVRVAAEAQFVTQSTMSAGIKELETLLGVQLAERDKRHVRLTAVGEDVVARAHPGTQDASSGLRSTSGRQGPLQPVRFHGQGAWCALHADGAGGLAGLPTIREERLGEEPDDLGLGLAWH
jgi:DNA-binding transcriptional LysR family regulator